MRSAKPYIERPLLIKQNSANTLRPEDQKAIERTGGPLVDQNGRQLVMYAVNHTRLYEHLRKLGIRTTHRLNKVLMALLCADGDSYGEYSRREGAVSGLLAVSGRKHSEAYRAWLAGGCPAVTEEALIGLARRDDYANGVEHLFSSAMCAWAYPAISSTARNTLDVLRTFSTRRDYVTATPDGQAICMAARLCTRLHALCGVLPPHNSKLLFPAGTHGDGWRTRTFAIRHGVFFYDLITDQETAELLNAFWEDEFTTEGAPHPDHPYGISAPLSVSCDEYDEDYYDY